MLHRQLNRRNFLQLATAAAVTTSLRAQTAAKATLTIGDKPLATMPLDFTGLSYESPQLCNPAFFSSANTDLVQLFRELGPTGGVLRLGGNLSAFTAWHDDPNMPITATEQTFLTLLVAQLSNQDPLQPTQGTDFVTQLAQFAQVEQSENQTSELTTMSSQLSGLANNETAQLVGQTVTIQGNTVNWNGTVATPSSATLASAASSVTATIVNSAGTTIRTITLPSEPAGALSIPWDGRDDSGANAPSGNYTVNVTATDSTGAPVTVTPSVTGKVQSISFAQGYAEITLASGAQAPVSQLVSVGAASTTP